MQQVQLLQISAEELFGLIKKGAAEALAEHQAQVTVQQKVTTAEAMALSGYKDRPSFAAFLKRNKIESCGTSGKYNLYLREEIVNAPHPKGIHL